MRFNAVVTNLLLGGKYLSPDFTLHGVNGQPC